MSKTIENQNAEAVDLYRLVRRFEVQQRCPLQGWNTWVIYDEKCHADEECARRISEAAPRDKNNWRVISSPNAEHHARTERT